MLIREGAKNEPDLILTLSNGNQHARWAAMEALIELDRTGLEPLLKSLIKDFDSVWLCEGAHHILHVLKNRGRLGRPTLKVFKALDGNELEGSIPWAAEAA